MATVQITFRDPVQVGGTSILSREPRVVQTITSSGTSQASTITGKTGEIADITASGNSVWIRVGANPTAATGTGDLVPDGGRVQIGFLQDGDKVAVIDVA